MSNETILTIASVVFGLLGLLFGIYKHFSTRRYAGISYEVSDLYDFALPKSFYDSINAIPFAVAIKSVGNKKAENINIRLVTSSNVTTYVIDCDEPYEKIQDNALVEDDKRIRVRVSCLNPEETVRITGQCAKTQDVIQCFQEISITHSEGVGVDKKSLSITEIQAELPFGPFTPRIKYNFERKRFEGRLW